ncbi:phytanoyl-CoA dioxygenase family protein [Caballeronia sp. dw_276]|uniref:phytanoyl-CoA dioxygenase family protein n=1 Tax=Caballeronia sp. dw_276 TaxID=2719795 RepID=UPI001BD396DC|nr:phytanoyl-CoA dioxygenase family protein [Caballeronia sp. dw_276]
MSVKEETRLSRILINQQEHYSTWPDDKTGRESPARAAHTSDVTAAFRSEGCLMARAAFSAAEVAALEHEISGAAGEYHPEATVVEEGRQSVRSMYGGHASSPLIHRLICDERLMAPAMELLGDEVYLYQFKINTKAPLVGDRWPWHQDYAFWAHLDGMPSPDAVTVAVYLDEVNEFNGPLFYIPGGHRAGLHRCEPATCAGMALGGSDVSANLRFTLSADVVGALVADHGLRSAHGPSGSAFFFHANLPHASGLNLSPYSRRQIFITYNAVGNALSRSPKRAEFLVARSNEPLRAISGSLLAA